MTEDLDLELSADSMEAYVSLFGLNDRNIALIEQECNVSVALRRNHLVITGENKDVELAHRTIMHMLDLKGICVSTGSACDSVNQQVSHVIKAIDVPADYREGTIRVTFGKDNSDQDAVDVANALIKLIRV